MGATDRPGHVLRGLLSAAGKRSSAILAYHGIGVTTRNDDPGRLMMPPDVFSAQVETLAEAGFEFVTVSELASRIHGGSPPPGLVAITFDDALRNLLDPLVSLAGQGVPTSVYVTTDWIGGRHPRVHDPEEGRILDPEELRALARAGIELGAHSVTHPDLSTLPFAEALEELRESRRALEGILDAPVETAAYPYGRYSEATRTAAGEAGFKVALAEETGHGWDALAMARGPVWTGGGWGAFSLKAAGRWPQLTQSRMGRLVVGLVRARRRVAPRR
jgi:peptidoglycan/xylan/chitin deacetylase (PgdA/CDA1 family)